MVSSKEIKIQGNSYTLPSINPGHIIDIETTKASITNGRYGDIIKSGTIHGTIALDLIEAISFILVLIPSFKDKLNIESIFKLDLVFMKELVSIYKKEIAPWYNIHIDLLKEDTKEKKE